MKKGFTRLHLITSLLFIHQLAQAQSPSGSGSHSFTMLLMAIVVLIAFFIIIRVSDNLVRIEANKQGVDSESNDFSALPSFGSFWGKKSGPAYAKGKFVALKQGHNILLEGKADGSIVAGTARTFAVQPPNFRSLSPIPKVEVEVGATVKAGDHLFYDKKNPDVKYVSPVSGEVVAVNRGGPEVVNGQTITFFGQSCVIEPTGRVVAVAPADEAGHTLHATVDTSIIREARRTWPIQQDRRPDVFRFLYDTPPYATESSGTSLL